MNAVLLAAGLVRVTRREILAWPLDIYKRAPSSERRNLVDTR
jgi:hypothetical protein